jgi:low temperature requirement protein LtrA
VTNKLFGFHIPMPARDHTEEDRASTTLELLYDLVVVIAVAFVVHALQRSVIENHIASGLLSYVMIFWSIWWAWMSFTWFASYYDTDDVPYRIAVFIQMVGALIMAAGVENAVHHDFTMVMFGYIIMRISLVVLWVRVIKSNPHDSTAAMRYATGTTLCQLGWIVLVLFLPPSFIIPGFFTLVLFEHFVPFYGDIKRQSRWHRQHIIERYGLLTIIVLGESLVALSTALQKLAENFNPLLFGVVLGGLLILFSMWWLYFDEKEHPALEYSKRAFIWGYGHFFIFTAIAATGGGLVVVTEQISGGTKIGPIEAVYSVVLPAAIYLLALWAIHDLPGNGNYKRKMQIPIAVALMVLAPLAHLGVLGPGCILVGLLIARTRK